MSCKEIVGVSKIEFCNPEQEKEFIKSIEKIHAAFNMSIESATDIMLVFASKIKEDADKLIGGNLSESIEKLAGATSADNFRKLPANSPVNPNNRKYSGKRKW